MTRGDIRDQPLPIRRLFLLVGAIVWVDTMFFAALTPLLPQFAAAFGLGKTGIGLLQAAYPAGTLLGAIPSGIVAARLGVKPTVLMGLATLAASSLGVGLAGTAWQLDAARFLQGLSGSFSWTGALAWLVSVAPADRRGRLIGTALGVAIGGALFGPVLGAAAAVAGTRIAFGVVAGLATGLFVWAARTAASPLPRPQPAALLIAALQTGPVLAGMWLVTLPALLFGTLSVLAPLRLSALGFGALAIAATWMISVSLEAIVSPVLGHVSDRVGRLRPLLGSLAAATAVLLVIPWPSNPYALAAMIICGGVAFGSFWTPAMALLSDAGEANGLESGWSFALINLAWAPGQAIGAASAGAIAAGSRDAVPYLLLAAICAITFGGVWRGRRALGAR